MNIIVGQNLTHHAYTQRYFVPTLNEQILSPSRLISYLELHLGLLKPEKPQFVRDQEWMNTVEKNKSGKFFESSFEVDPIGTCRHLLQLRDELKLAGWDGKAIEGFKKVSDLFAINAEFSNESGLPERIRLVIEVLNSVEKKIVNNIQLINDPEFTTPLWKELFSALEKNGTSVSFYEHQFINSDRPDLQSAKEAFSAISAALPKEDGSLEIFVSDGVRESADQLARYLSTKNQEEFKNIVLISNDRYRPILANSFAKFNIPFSGDSSAKSLSRPSVQILLLALGLVWSPKDPKVALALLLHPSSPLPKWISGRLTRALERLPAVGSADWQKEIKKIIEYLEKKETPKKDIDKHLERINKWFSIQITGVENEVEKSHLISICNMVGDWARKRSSSDESLLQTSSICSYLKAFLENWNSETVNKEVFRKILRETIDQGNIYQEKAPFGLGPIMVSSPAEVLFEASEIIWWDANSSSINTSSRSYWSLKERRLLQENGIAIIDPQYSSELHAQKWQNPIGYAKDKVAFFTFSKKDDGEKDYLHPVFNQILNPNEIDLWLSTVSINPGQTDNALTNSFMASLNVTMETDKPEFELEPVLNWDLSKSDLGLRDWESPSSLEILMGCPLSYLLKYHSSLSGSYIPNIHDIWKLIGTLNHKVLELVFSKGKPPTVDEAKSKVKEKLEELVPEMVPELLLPRYSLIYKSVQSKLENAAITYTSFLHENGLEIMETEATKEKQLLEDLKISGQVDQLLSKDGEPASVIDFKIKLWNSFRDKIKNGTSIQLAIYSWLHKSSTWPDIGYFGVDKSKLIVAGKYTESADPIEDAPLPSEVIDNLIGLIKQRKDEFKKGEVQARGLVDEEEQGNFKAPCHFCDYDGICGLRWQS